MPEKKGSESRRFGVYILLFIGIICILISLYLGFRIFERVGHRPPPVPRQTDVSLIQEWMTIPFIARSYQVPEAELFAYLEINSQTDRRLNLVSLATKKGISAQLIISQIQEYITQFQANQTKPSPP